MYLYRRRVRPETWQRARECRQNPTFAEAALWGILRDGTFGKFHRQKVMLGYIVDFWCPSTKLAIELDGNLHVASYDEMKDRRLKSIGVNVLRFHEETPPWEIVARITEWMKAQRKPPNNRPCRKHPESGRTEWGTCWQCYAEKYATA